MDRAIDLACHEGYPGHHVYNVLLEKNLVRDRGWVEFSVYPLFSPQSLIAEGTANFGIDVAFPESGAAGVRAQRDLPGRRPRPGRRRGVLRGARARRSAVVRRQRGGAPLHQRRRSTRRARPSWLERYALYSPPRAAQRVRFIDQYRSYVINYNLGKDMVERYIEAQGGTRVERRRGAGRSSSS